MTVDPTESETAGKVGDESPIRPDKIVTAAEVHAEVMIFYAANDRLGHERETELIVTARPIVGVVYAPANSGGDKLRRDLVAVGISKNAKQVTGLHGNFPAWRIEWFAAFCCGEQRLNQKRDAKESRAKSFHDARTIGRLSSIAKTVSDLLAIRSPSRAHLRSRACSNAARDAAGVIVDLTSASNRARYI